MKPINMRRVRVTGIGELRFDVLNRIGNVIVHLHRFASYVNALRGLTFDTDRPSLRYAPSKLKSHISSSASQILLNPGIRIRRLWDRW